MEDDFHALKFVVVYGLERHFEVFEDQSQFMLVRKQHGFFKICDGGVAELAGDDLSSVEIILQCLKLCLKVRLKSNTFRSLLFGYFLKDSMQMLHLDL